MHHPDSPSYATILRRYCALSIIMVAAVLIPEASVAQLSVACPSQPQPIGQTNDGYPAFNMNFCPSSNVTSSDGKNTSASGGSYTSELGGGYQCWELASRYFHFAYQVNISGSVAADLCPGGSGSWTGNASRTTTPIPGDLVVYSETSAAPCNLGIGPAGHIAVVTAVHGTTFDSVNQNWGLAPPKQSNGYLYGTPLSCACGFIHAAADTGQSNSSSCGSSTPSNNPNPSTITTACPEQAFPMAFTADGYPAFDENMCLNGGKVIPVASTDGINTYDASTGIGYINGVAQSTKFPIITTPDPRDGRLGTGPNNAFQSWHDAYMCDELPHRYFHFKYKMDIIYPDYPSDLCPQGPSNNGKVIPMPGSGYTATFTSTPSPGDVVVYSSVSGAGVSLNNPSCNYSSLGAGSHIAVVTAIQNGGITYDAVNEHFGPTGPNGEQIAYAGIWPAPAGHIPKECACTFIHPTGSGNPLSGSSSGSSCDSEPYAHAVFLTGPSAALDGSGQLVVFVRGIDGQLYYKFQKGTDGGYPSPNKTEQWNNAGSANDGWTPIQGANNMLSDPVVAPHGYIASNGYSNGFKGGQLPAGELEVFYIGTDNQVWHVWQNAPVKENYNNDTMIMPPVTSDGSGWSTPAAIGGNAAGQVGVLLGNALFYIDQYQTIYTIYRQGLSYMGYDPTKTYTWSKPVALTKKYASYTNPAPTYTADNFAYIHFAAPDRSIMQMVNKTNVGLNPGSSGWSAPALVTTMAGGGPGAATSNVVSAWDPSGGLSVFYRGPDHSIWQIPPTGTYNGGGDVCGWCSGTYGTPHIVPGTDSSSDVVVGNLNGYLQMFYRNAEGGMQSQKQVGLPDPLTHDPRWYKAFNLIGNSGANAKKNTTGLPYLYDQTFSIPARAYNQNLRNEVFFIGSDGSLYSTYELTTPQLVTTSPYALSYPSWSDLVSLGNPVSLIPPQSPTGGTGGGLSGYNPYCSYISNGGLDQTGLDFIAKWEGTISGCYCDPILGCGAHTTWGIGTEMSTLNSCTANGHQYSTVCPNTNPCGEWIGDDQGYPNPLPACDVPQSDFLACAEDALKTISLGFMKELGAVIPCTIKLTQNQFDALASVAYNCGPGMGGCVGPIVSAILQGTPPYQGAADAILASGSFRSPARAQAEAILFCTGSGDPTVNPPIPPCTVGPSR